MIPTNNRSISLIDGPLPTIIQNPTTQTPSGTS